jgi:hypothetical protein
VKINSNNKRRILLAVLVLATLVLTRCKKYDDLGMELLPSTDLITVKNTILKDDISAFTIREDSIRTDRATKSLLGSFNDPVFGNTTIDFATHFRLVAFPDYGENPEADSIFLYLYYRGLYGDTVTTQRIQVFEMEERLYADTTSATGGTSAYPYYQYVDLKSMASDQPVGELEFVPQIRLDSTETDTFYQVLKVPLDMSLAEKLINADSSQMISNDVFLNFFKGLYVETEKVSGGEGSILTLEAASDDSFQGSALVVYYNNDANRADTTPDTLSMPYIVTEFSARVNHIEHDYTGTPFFENITSGTTEDSLIYIQTTGGLETKINIDNLTLWKDSANTAINKAELVFQIDTIASDLENYPAPDQLLFTFIDSTGREYLPKDYSFSPAFYGGALDDDDYTYRFNITQHLQQIIDGELGNHGFRLTTANKNNEAKRVILKGSTSETGIRLIITYSKFLQQ